MNTETALFNRIQSLDLSVAKLVQWGEHLSVEHPGIDAQHKAIFDLGARIHEHWRHGGVVDELRPSVDKLVNMLQVHFAYEERLLGEIGYADLKQHAAEHRSMLDDLELIHERFHRIVDGHEARGGSLLAPGWPIMQFMLGVTVGHVMTSDMSYCKALIASRRGEERFQGLA